MTPYPAVPEPRFAVPELLDASGFAGLDFGATLADLAGETMGTRWSVRAALPSRIAAEALERAVQRRLEELVAQMSHWDDDSRLSLFNAAPADSWHDLPRDFAMVMAAALDVADASGGAFDPALGRVTDCWGLGPNPAPIEPSEAELAVARAASGWRRLKFDAATARLCQPGGTWLDLSGIAKGHAADTIADLLAERGVAHALVEVGGECTGRGIRPDGDPWWVELEAPPGASVAPLRVALHQLAVATSGNYLRGAHALDRETGRPAFDGPASVSVIHPSCMIADAWASAFAVLAEARARELADNHRLAVRAITHDGREWLSDAMEAMLD